MSDAKPYRRKPTAVAAALTAITLIGLLTVPTPSPAAIINAVIVAGPGGFLPNGQYLTPVAVIGKGGSARLTNLDVALHDVKSPLFSSGGAGVLESRNVKGVQFLKKGSYAFKCSVHPWMKGTLRVI